MQPVWSFLAEHRFLLWIGVAYGGLGIVMHTVLYRRSLYCYFILFRRIRDRYESKTPPYILQGWIRFIRIIAHIFWLWLMTFLFNVAVFTASVIGLIVL